MKTDHASHRGAERFSASPSSSPPITEYCAVKRPPNASHTPSTSSPGTSQRRAVVGLAESLTARKSYHAGCGEKSKVPPGTLPGGNELDPVLKWTTTPAAARAFHLATFNRALQRRLLVLIQQTILIRVKR